MIHNGRVWPAQGPATGLATVKDRILTAGSEAEVHALVGPSTRVIDAGGGLIIPGLQDSHVHFRSGARNLSNLELSAETTVEGVLTRIREFARSHPEREWLTGRGWFYAVFSGGMPDRNLLDPVVGDRPVAIEAYDVHSTWLNSVALSRLGIDHNTPDPPRGEGDDAGAL